jgi:hypothetical protein
VSGWDWVFSVAYMLAFMYVFLVKTTCTWLADRNSPYAFAEGDASLQRAVEARASD